MKNKELRNGFIKFFNALFFILFILVVVYIGFYTEIPSELGNVIRKEIEERKQPFEIYNQDFIINDLSIKNNMYYYNTLTQEQKYIYESIANGVKNFDNEFVVRNYIADTKETFASDVSVALEAFTNDHPEVFYLKAQYSSYIRQGFEGNIGYIKLNYTEDSVSQIKNKIAEVKGRVEYYARDLDGLSDFEKELIIHDRIAYDVKYYNLEDIPRKYHTAEGTLLEGVGVCDSFSKAYQLVLNRVGIDSIIVLGNLDGNPHAWNMVKIGDNWYHVDITSSHSIYDETKIVNHAYFNLTTESEKKFVTIDNEDIIPPSTSTEYNYYNYRGLVINENDDISLRLKEIDEFFKGRDYIEFYLKGDVSSKISRIINALRNLNENYLDGSKLYYYNINNAIIIQKN